jgi:hypothetical protein
MYFGWTRIYRGLTVAAASWIPEARATSVESDWVFILEEEKQKTALEKRREGFAVNFSFLQGRCACEGVRRRKRRMNSNNQSKEASDFDSLKDEER